MIYESDPEKDLELNLNIVSVCNKNLKKPELKGKLRSFFLVKKANSLNNLGLYYRYDAQIEKSLEAFEKSIEIEKELGNTDGVARALNNIGLLYSDVAKMKKALNYFDQALEKYREIEDKSGMAMVYNNIGIIYYDRGDIPVALEYYYKEMKLEEEVGNQDGIASSLNNIAILYAEQGDTARAFENFEKVREIRIQQGYQFGIASSTNNIGLLYFNQGKYEKALKHYFESVSIYEKIGNRADLGGTLSNIAQVFEKKKDFRTAIRYALESIKILDGIENPQALSKSYYTLASIYYQKGDISQARESALKSLKIAQEIGFPLNIQNAAKILSAVYEEENQGMKALEMHKLFVRMRDSIQNEKTRNSLVQQKAQYKYDKQKAIDDAKHEKEIAIEKKERERQRTIIYAVISGAILLALFLIFVFNRLAVTRRQKNEINAQKEEIAFQHEQLEQNHKEIKDSITYAQRLQNAILPSIHEITNHIPNNFVYFRPKDVVSGDFYWFEKIDSTIFVAAADCTGHGVPGAMVSVVCSNALNRAVKEFSLTRPSDILNKTRELVVEHFSRSGSDVSDGMDIAFCAFNKNKMTFSGANNPVWIVKKTQEIEAFQKEEKRNIIQESYSLIEIRGDRRPVGKYRDMSPFTEKTIELEEGDLIYLFSDGFSDQFGGESIAGKKGGKKFKYKRFKQFLLSINQMPMEEQKEHLNRTFEMWKGDFEQVDDVCVIGLRF